MSAPPEKIPKPPPLLLHGIAPHLFQSRTKPRISSKLLKPMDDPATSHQKGSSDSSQKTRAALEDYGAAQLEVENLKALLQERDVQIADLRAALDAAQVKLFDVARQTATIASLQATMAGLQAASAAAVEQLKAFVQVE